MAGDAARFGETEPSRKRIDSGRITVSRRLLGRTAATVPALCFCSHRRPLCRCNQGANVLNSPRGNARPKFYRLGETASSDALPPAGFLDRDDRGDGRLCLGIANDLRQAEKAGFWKLVHLCPLLSKLRRIRICYVAIVTPIPSACIG